MGALRIFTGYLRLLIFLVVLLVAGFGCGPSAWGLHLKKLSDETRREKKAADVQAALAVFFSNEHDLTNPLPAEITSLPIFSDDPTNIIVTSCDGSTNVLMLSLGAGYGHWGLIVARPGHDKEISGWHRKKSQPWNDGVYFFSEYTE